MRMNNFTQYKPTDPPYGENALYLQDDKGRDWYASQGKFKKAFKLAIDPVTGVIHSIAEDVSALFPSGLTVVDIDEIPAGCTISGDWIYHDGNITKSALSDQNKANHQKAELMKAVSAQIEVITDAIALQLATPEEQARLVELQTYRVMLSRIDTSTAPDITWPEAP